MGEGGLVVFAIFLAALLGFVAAVADLVRQGHVRQRNWGGR